MRPLLPCEGGDARLHCYPPRDALERSRRVRLLVSAAVALRRRSDLAAEVDTASAWRFLRAEAAVLGAHLDAEQASLGGVA